MLVVSRWEEWLYMIARWFWRRMVKYSMAQCCVLIACRWDDSVLYLQYKRRVNPPHRVNEHTRSVDPWSEHIGVGGLGPAWVCQVPVHVRRTQVHPVLGGNGVTEAVAGAWELSHLGWSRSATRKEHLHNVSAASLNGLHKQLYTTLVSASNYLLKYSPLISDSQEFNDFQHVAWTTLSTMNDNQNCTLC